VRGSFRAMASTRFRKMLNHGRSLRLRLVSRLTLLIFPSKLARAALARAGGIRRVRFRMQILIVNTNNWGDLYHACLQNFKQ
jgi:hypothetical protein